MSGGGWFPDPSGRFGQRWYDGATWTGRVVAANGQVVDDPLPSTAEPAGPPPVRQQPPDARLNPPPRPESISGVERYGPGPGLLVGIAGLVVVALSLFVLKWADMDNGTFLDLSKAARDAGSDGADKVIYTYAAFGGFVLFGLAAVWAVLAGLPLPATRGSNTYHRVVGSVICGGAAIYQAAAITHVFRGPASPEIGAWAGVVGYFVIVVGTIVGVRRVTP
jgi:hypothetical protein